MNLLRLWAIARKEFLHVIRDVRSLAMSIAIPVLLLVLYGYALTLDVDDVPLVVWDQSETPASREFISRFEGSRYFSLRKHVSRYADLERSIDTQEAMAGLVIPRDFAGRLEAGDTVSVQLIIDGSDSNTATLAKGYAESVAQTWSQEIALRLMWRAGGRLLPMPFELRPRVWFNEELKSRNYIIPGLIAVIMSVIAALLTSLTVAREWERGTMEQLISTPVKGPELIIGKLFPYSVIGMLDMLLAVLMGQYLFHVPLRGSVILVFAMGALFLLGCFSLGILISVLTRNQLASSQISMIITYLPSFLLSGLLYDIENLPVVLQFITYIFSARYFVALLKGIYLKGLGLDYLAFDAVMLALFAIIIVTLAITRFRKKLV